MKNFPNRFGTAYDLFNRSNPKTKTINETTDMVKLSTNTTLERKRHHDGGMTISVLLHGNSIVDWKSDGTASISHCGYKTPTTKRRLNQFGFAVHQEKGEWFITTSMGVFEWGDDIEITIHGNGMVK